MPTRAPEAHRKAAASQVRLWNEHAKLPGVPDVFLSRPDTTRHSMELETDAFNVTCVCMQGWRNTMEDAHTIELELTEGVSLFAVFDGHGGIETAKYAAAHLASHVTATKAFHKKDYVQALKEAYRTLDYDICSKQDDGHRGSGSTAVTCIITPTHVYTANVGDSRAILCQFNKKQAYELSTDHKPTLESEKRRVEYNGGFIQNDRVSGVLAMTRALGDVNFKRGRLREPERQVVTCIPEVTIHELTHDDDAIILACDGIWDCIRSQELCQFFIEEEVDHQDWALMCENLCEILVAPTLHQFGTDNMTIMAVRFNHLGRNHVHTTKTPTAAAPRRPSFSMVRSASPTPPVTALPSQGNVTPASPASPATLSTSQRPSTKGPATA